MSNESPERTEIADTSDTAPGVDEAIVQLGSRKGNIADNRGAFARAEKDVVGISETGRTGDIGDTLSGSLLARHINQELAQGKTEIVFDFSRAKSLSEIDIQEIIARRDALRRRGAVLSLTGLKPADELKLRQHSAQSGGTEMFTEQRTESAFKETPAKTAIAA